METGLKKTNLLHPVFHRLFYNPHCKAHQDWGYSQAAVKEQLLEERIPFTALNGNVTKHFFLRTA